MSYVPPRRWSHGDIPEAADLQILSDNQAWNYGRLVQINPALVPVDRSDESAYTYPATRVAYLVHAYRWLWYRTDPGGSGTVEDPAGVETSVSLPDTNGQMGVYDLDNVTWLFAGRIYRVSGVTHVGEDKES